MLLIIGINSRVKKKKQSFNLNISTNSNVVQGDNSIGLLYAIVDSWNRNGVPIRASINSAEGKIEPDNVNNKTGVSDRRNW